MAKKVTDLMAPFRATEDAARRQSARGSNIDAEIQIRGKLQVEIDDGAIALSLAQHLAQAIEGEIDANKFQPSEETRARRARRASVGRYPGGFSANPEGPYGTDSGYLRENIKASIDSGNVAFVGIPKERQKAAFVLRRISKTAEEGINSKAAPEVKESLENILRKMVVGGR